MLAPRYDNAAPSPPGGPIWAQRRNLSHIPISLLRHDHHGTGHHRDTAGYSRTDERRRADLSTYSLDWFRSRGRHFRNHECSRTRPSTTRNWRMGCDRCDHARPGRDRRCGSSASLREHRTSPELLILYSQAPPSVNISGGGVFCCPECRRLIARNDAIRDSYINDQGGHAEPYPRLEIQAMRMSTKSEVRVGHTDRLVVLR